MCALPISGRFRSIAVAHRQSASRHRDRSKASRQYAAPTKRSGYRGSARSLWSPNIKRAPQRREHRQNPSKLDSWLAPLQVHTESPANVAGGGKLYPTHHEPLALPASDFSYGISIEHHGFPDRVMLTIFTPPPQ